MGRERGENGRVVVEYTLQVAFNIMNAFKKHWGSVKFTRYYYVQGRQTRLDRMSLSGGVDDGTELAERGDGSDCGFV